MSTQLPADVNALRARLQRYGQAHLLRFWDRLDAPQRAALIEDITTVDFDRCSFLTDTYVRAKPAVTVVSRVEPADAWPPQPTATQLAAYAAARAAGDDAIRTGRIGAFTVAGGQGTRLGFEGPKGAFPISPIRGTTLFELFAEGLRGTARRYGRPIRWYIMTSPSNHDETGAFFEKQGFFGLTRDDVVFFQQRQMPAFLPDGRIALSERGRVALSPDGHGGSLRALAESGALADMKRHGIDLISYFQVDNPLVRTIDPLFIGLHVTMKSEMSTKVVSKAHDLEPVGVICKADGKTTVIEYSDLPRELATARNADGSRRFDAGNIAVHVLDRPFVERLTAPGSTVQLPWHRAEKKVPTVDENGDPINPDRPNAVKLEMFIFDAIPLARDPLVLFTRRDEEFSPVKNAAGDDSPATARRDFVRRAARWLEQCGVTVPLGGDGEARNPIEISPAFALDAEDLEAQLKSRPLPRVDQPLLLA